MFLRLDHFGLHANVLGSPFPVQFQDNLPSLALRDDLGQIPPARDIFAVDGYDRVPGMQSGRLGRRARLHAPDLRGEARNSHHENDGEGKDGKQKIEEGPRYDDGDFPQDVLFHERALLILGQNVIGFRFAQQLHIAPQGHERDHVLGFADLPSDELRAKTQGEFQHAHSQRLGQQEMTQLMDKDQDTQQNDNRCDIDTDTHPILTLFLFSIFLRPLCEPRNRPTGQPPGRICPPGHVGP